MIGPKSTPKEHGFKLGDSHLIVNDLTETIKAYDFTGKKLWELPCLARGQGSDFVFNRVATDTPPGLYKLGEVYKDYEQDHRANYSRERMEYGWYSFDMIELENQETRYGRAGIMIHGGGTANGWPGAWEPFQRLYSTYGCVRMYNKHLQDYILPLYKKGTVFVSVYQED